MGRDGRDDGLSRPRIARAEPRVRRDVMTELPDTSPLRTLTAAGPTLVVFLRHFG